MACDFNFFVRPVIPKIRSTCGDGRNLRPPGYTLLLRVRQRVTDVHVFALDHTKRT